MAGIYIHIPFCKQACSYCDFYFVTRRDLMDPFVEKLVREIQRFKGTHYTEETVQTIYFGGGTPSQLGWKQLSEIMKALDDVFRIEADEVTMELNPDDVTPEYLSMIRDAGITRASMGVQSFQPELLKFMHRAHTRDEALQALETIKKTGFPDYTADLIFGNPGQTNNMLRDDIELLLKFEPTHISAYSLTVEPRTRLGRQVEIGRIQPPDDEVVSGQFDLLRQTLDSAGLQQYEVSNYSLPDREAVHNSHYWNHRNYLGLGPSAHSFWWNNDKAVRSVNKPDLNAYLNSEPESYIKETEELSLETLAEERLMLGLRTRWGVTENELFSRYMYRFSEKQLKWIDPQVKQETLTFKDGLLQLTPSGLKIADLLIVDLLSKR